MVLLESTSNLYQFNSEILHDLTLKDRFKRYDGERSPIRAKVAEYASLTLPWIMPAVDRTQERQSEELPVPAGSIGARAVNHLANKIATSLFIPSMPFMKLDVTEAGYVQAEQIDGLSRAALDTLLAKVEHEAISSINAAQHRAQSVLAVKQAIITGNALLYYPEDGAVQVYNFHDYVWKRNMEGEVVEFLTCERVNTEQLTPELNKQLEDKNLKPIHDHVSVEIFTRVHRKYTGINKYVWKVQQAIEDIELDIDNDLDAQYKADELPWMFITWNLARGEDYGRGLIEDYYYAFEAHRILSASQMRMFAIMANKKFFVEPGAVTNPEMLNRITESPPGSFHELPKDSVWTIEHVDAEVSVVYEKIQALEREIAQSFLLNSAAVREAERVTAEEIRMQVQELETSFGGIYSKLATDWQVPLGKLLLVRVKAKDILDIPEVTMTVVTGIEAMSRMGELENVRTLLSDMAGIGSMAPTVLERLKLSDLWMLMASLRGIDAFKIIYTDKEFQELKQAEQEQAMQQQQQLQQSQAAADTQTALAQSM